VRQAREEGVVLTSYGRASGFCADPIEKKPLFHFLPGTGVFSFGTAGCNLGCRFCQNWSISKAREMALLDAHATPEDVAEAALAAGCRSVAFTYNDPVIFAEYAIDCARAAHERGLATVAVSAGYISPEARPPSSSISMRRTSTSRVSVRSFTGGYASVRWRRCSIHYAGCVTKRRSGWKSPT
jgi:pyruvate formate lyase activating enzyme